MIGGIAKAAGSAILGLGINKLGERSQRKQQKKLQEQQIKGAKELKDYDNNKQMEIWNKTNYEAQMKHMKNAGLNPALMYGQGGGAGGTLGGGGMAMPTEAVAEPPSQGTGKIMEMAMMKAQMAVLESQADKNRAEADKTRGIDTEEATSRTREAGERATSLEFQNRVNELIGEEAKYRNYGWANDKLEISASKEKAEWETFLKMGYEGKSFDNENTPIAKAMKAGWEKAVIELERAKKENNIKNAEVTIKNFEAGMAEQGLSPNSPWGVKFGIDLLKKVGINVSEETKGIK